MTNVLLLISGLTVIMQPPPPPPTTPRDTQLQPSTIEDVRVHLFHTAFVRDCNRTRVAQSVHIMGLPNDIKTLKAVMPILLTRSGPFRLLGLLLWLGEL